jgi:pimeloyl-ACP methyl ester carboxylesterase
MATENKASEKGKNMADHNAARTESGSHVKHRTVEIDGIRIFYREAGPEDAAVVLLPHGYPSSSFQFRNFMPALADRWRLIAPDYPGFGYSATPDRTRFFLYLRRIRRLPGAVHDGDEPDALRPLLARLRLPVRVAPSALSHF